MTIEEKAELEAGGIIIIGRFALTRWPWESPLTEREKELLNRANQELQKRQEPLITPIPLF